jgi:K+-transporting ATPase ATPase C chain
MAIISMILCGLVFPLAQVFLPYQANGDIVQFKGHNAGSIYIAQNFTSPMFFHSRNASASGVDPDITLDDAYSQIPRIHTATGIPTDTLKNLVDENVERTIWISGEPYVNVLKLNLMLAQEYPSIYKSFG